ncbi:MAG TPA: hypothetical protein VNF99_01740 [Stellaceae bacterium]|nr:hypothetical protein [Stellaceae bacterium]
MVRETPSALGPKAKDALRIHVIDVDSGNCVLIECPESNTSGPHALLNDCGSNRAKTVGARVAAYVRGVLAGYGPRSVDILVSHPDADHYNLITSLFAGDEGIVGEVAVSGVLADYKLTHFPEFAARHPAFATLAPTQTTRLRPCGALTPVVLVADLPGRPNRRSAVLWLDYGEFLVLDPGDAQGKTETQALDNQAAADLAPDEEPLAGTLLLASHHGAATARSNSQNWIANVKPSLVLVSAGDPRSYGHPRCAVVERYLAAIPKEAAKHYLACPESKRDWNHTIATTGNIFSTHDCGDLVVTYTPSDDPPVALKFDGSCDVPTETGRPAIPTVSGS